MWERRRQERSLLLSFTVFFRLLVWKQCIDAKRKKYASVVAARALRTRPRFPRFGLLGRRAPTRAAHARAGSIPTRRPRKLERGLKISAGPPRAFSGAFRAQAVVVALCLFFSPAASFVSPGLQRSARETAVKATAEAAPSRAAAASAAAARPIRDPALQLQLRLLARDAEKAEAQPWQGKRMSDTLAAQHGRVSTVKCLEQGLKGSDADSRSALSGHLWLTDKADGVAGGRTARDMAEAAGHDAVIDELDRIAEELREEYDSEEEREEEKEDAHT